MVVPSPHDLDAATVGIADELSKQYYLVYLSPGKKDDRWHSIRVEVRNGRYRMRARRGYVASWLSRSTDSVNDRAMTDPIDRSGIGHRHRFRRFFADLGPRLTTGAADDDPSGISTYSVAGAAFGYAPLWTAVFSFPLMAAVQLMCARLGVVTGRGLGGVIRRQYPRWVLWGACGLLIVANVVNVAADLGGIQAADLSCGQSREVGCGERTKLGRGQAAGLGGVQSGDAGGGKG